MTTRTIKSRAITKKQKAISIKSGQNPKQQLAEPLDKLVMPVDTAIPSALPIKITAALPETISEVITTDGTKIENFGGQPILFGLTETPEITADFLPPWIRDFAHEISEAHQIPVEMAAMTGLAILGACLQKKFLLSTDEHSYVEPLNIFALIALPASNRQTTVLDAMLGPILGWECEEANKLSSSIADTKVVQSYYNKKQQRLTNMAAKTEVEALTQKRVSGWFIPNGSTHGQAKELLDKALVAKEDMPISATPKRIIATDATTNNLLVELSENDGKTAIISDNGDILKNIDLHLLTQSFMAGSLKTKIDKKNYVFLQHIAITMGLIVTPETLKNLTSNSNRQPYLKQLLSTMLFCLPKSNIGRRNIRNRKVVSPAVRAAYAYGIDFLLNIPLDVIVDREEGRYRRVPWIIYLTEEALGLWLQFSEWLESQLTDGGKLEYLKDWAANLAEQALRLAGLCHIAWLIEPSIEPEPLSPSSALSKLFYQNWNINSKISRERMEIVLELCKKLLLHARAAYELIDDDKCIADAKYALNWILTHAEVDENGAFFVRQNALHCTPRFKNSKVERVIRALDILFEQNIVSLPCKLATRKPTKIRFINPLIFKLKDQFKLISTSKKTLAYAS